MGKIIAECTKTRNLSGYRFNICYNLYEGIDINENYDVRGHS